MHPLAGGASDRDGDSLSRASRRLRTPSLVACEYCCRTWRLRSHSNASVCGETSYWAKGVRDSRVVKPGNGCAGVGLAIDSPSSDVRDCVMSELMHAVSVGVSIIPVVLDRGLIGATCGLSQLLRVLIKSCRQGRGVMVLLDAGRMPHCTPSARMSSPT